MSWGLHGGFMGPRRPGGVSVNQISCINLIDVSIQPGPLASPTTFSECLEIVTENRSPNFDIHFGSILAGVAQSE